jgi:hypothetical protein
VAIVDPRGTFVTLSHVCPTAARLLLEDVDAQVVSAGPVIDHHLAIEGLDARDALPPLLTRDLLWDWEGWDRWERGAAALLATGDRAPEEKLGELRAAVSAVVRWRPSDGALEDAVAAAFETAQAAAEPFALTPEVLCSLCHAVESSIPEPLKPSGLRLTPIDVPPAWHAWSAAVGRYLAARAFANWVGYYGSGIETWFRSVVAAYAVLIAATAEAPTGTLDADALVRAFGDADRVMLHLSAAPALAAALDTWEER